jgi:class 3 adenylate cyclase
MTTEDFRRKLTAILHADIEGYSRLMGENEDETIRTLAAYREVIAAHIQLHQGRLVDFIGDELLAEFASVGDAVLCATEIQKELRVLNAELPEGRKMLFRIGINLGDVVEEGERIYGDGVNVAARLDELAGGEGICISGAVYDSIKNKLTYNYEYLGEQTVKNIADPVRVYRVMREPETTEASSVQTQSIDLPAIPSIAVLPFTNMSNDPEQEYFADGITEDMITDLSKISGLFVISRSSVFGYKGTSVKLEQIGRELGVHYVLEGSVRKDGDRVRINAQLIDAATAMHLWAERYDGHLGDVFALQDEITQKIISALAIKLTPSEEEQVTRKETDNIEAYDTFLKGLEHYLCCTPDDLDKAIPYFKKAIELDPNFGRAGATLDHITKLIKVYESGLSSKEIIAQFGISPDKIKLGGERRFMTVLFTDIAGFSLIVESLDPEETVRLLNEYFTVMTDSLFKYGGILDKYFGDGIMAFFGAPLEQPDHALQACRASLEMMNRLKEVPQRWAEEDPNIPFIDHYIGINTGLMLVGNMGSKFRFDYTVLGDAVNRGSWLESANRTYGTNILIGDTTYEQVKEAMICREVDAVRVGGTAQFAHIYELLGEKGQVSEETIRLAATFDKGLKAYQSQQWDQAEDIFTDLNALDPNDKPTQIYLRRVAELKKDPPPKDWDGIFVRTTASETL